MKAWNIIIRINLSPENVQKRRFLWKKKQQTNKKKSDNRLFYRLNFLGFLILSNRDCLVARLQKALCARTSQDSSFF